MKWIETSNCLPDSEEVIDYCSHEYYLVKTKRYGKQFAMFIDNKWYSSHSSIICDEVTHWMKVEEPCPCKWCGGSGCKWCGGSGYIIDDRGGTEAKCGDCDG